MTPSELHCEMCDTPAACSGVQDFRVRVEELEARLEGVLLYHSASPWTDEKAKRWEQLMGITPEHGATTRALCDAIRAALQSKEKGPTGEEGGK